MNLNKHALVVHKSQSFGVAYHHISSLPRNIKVQYNMSLVPIFILILGALLPFTSASAGRSLYPLYGYNQKYTKEILEHLAGGKFKDADGSGYYRTSDVYNSNYRPPATTEGDANATVSPTLITVRMKNIRVQELNETEHHADVIFVVGMNWTDSRLTFEMPSDYDRNFINGKFGSSYNQITPWLPEITTDGYGYARDPYTAYARYGARREISTYITSDGEVYMEWQFSMRKREFSTDEKSLTHHMQFFESSLWEEDIIYEWAKDEAVSVSKVKGTVKSMQGNTFEISAEPHVCDRSENYGPIGIRKHACVEMKLKLTQK